MINSAVDPLVPAVKGDYLHERSAKSTLVNVDTISLRGKIISS
jgi:hypothetical protein